jgi:tetraacyldisaccharide 4'-kinase
MKLAATELINIKTRETISVNGFLNAWGRVNAIAGIGDPDRFFDTLKSLNFKIEKQQGFIDHKEFVTDDFNHFKKDLPLLMTEKDAVKCQTLAQENWWYLPVDAKFSVQDEQILIQKIQAISINET